MHASEIDDCLKGLVCQCDSREQDTPRLKARLKQIGYPIERIALNVGDYSAKIPLPDGSWYQIPCSIERKMNTTELCMCYCQDRDRFTREFERARETSTRVYLLIEDSTWENIYAGKYRSRMASKSLVASILTWLARYECQILMCKAETSGKLIRDILYRESKEALERMVDE